MRGGNKAKPKQGGRGCSRGNTGRWVHSRSLQSDILARCRCHHGDCSTFRSLELGKCHWPLQAALSGSLIKAPGFAGGYLLLPVVAAVVLRIAVPGYAQNAATSQFDHNATGFLLTGTHVSVPCASCHINARYKTTPRACFGCHNGMTAPGAASVLSHPVTTNYCEGCHQTTTWRDYRFIDHVQALGPCANCHNNKIAAGKTPNHPITNAACNTCHFDTVTFKGGILPPNTPQTPAAAATTSTTATPPTTTTAPPNTSSSKLPSAQTPSRMPGASTKPSH